MWCIETEVLRQAPLPRQVWLLTTALRLVSAGGVMPLACAATRNHRVAVSRVHAPMPVGGLDTLLAAHTLPQHHTHAPRVISSNACLHVAVCVV
ncbi:hypothetical protein COO60DRAFT_760518 [Scenedesmus sp. NREL 46B-D3]|nr:hypothetical protein COO60DRAFT_760518 [Scenedesmus sp. NREL 46B-D3]